MFTMYACMSSRFCTFVCMYVCMYVCLYVCMCVRMTYMHACVHTYIHTYTTTVSPRTEREIETEPPNRTALKLSPSSNSCPTASLSNRTELQRNTRDRRLCFRSEQRHYVSAKGIGHALSGSHSSEREREFCCERYRPFLLSLYEVSGRMLSAKMRGSWRFK